MKLKTDEGQGVDVLGPNVELLKSTAVWHDINAYFRELFTGHPAKAYFAYTTETLLMDFEARFGSRYDPAAMVKLLSRGFELANGNFMFYRSDFFVPSVERMRRAE